MTILRNYGQGDSSSRYGEKLFVNNVIENDISNIMHIIQNDNANFDDLIQKELNQLKKCKTNIKNLEQKYFLSTDDFKEQQLIKPTKTRKTRHKVTTLYKKSDFYNINSSFDTVSSVSVQEKQSSNTSTINTSETQEHDVEDVIDKENCIKNKDIKVALEKLERMALRMPSVKVHRSRNDTKEKLKQRDKRKITKKYKVKLYNFMLPENSPVNTKVKCPPFKMLLEHTIAVILLIFTRKEMANNIRFAHLKWAIFFLKALSKRKRQKELTICMKKLKEYLSEIKLKKHESMECKISVETVNFENIKQDSLMFKRLNNVLRKEKITKEGREALSILTNMVTKLKLHSEKSIKKDEISLKPYSYISQKIEKMGGLFNNILTDIKDEKLRLMSSLRTNHGSLAISLCKIEKDLNELLAMRDNYLVTHNKLEEAIQKLVTINDFLSLFEKRSTLESKFNNSVDSSLRKLKMIRRSLENISESIYSNLIL